MDDMVIKTSEDRKHVKDLEDTFASIRSYNMRLKSDKCTFRVQAGKFLGLLLTSPRTEANLDKCQVIIDMRSPSIVKEVQQLTIRLADLSRFLSCAGDKSIIFFVVVRKSTKFQWT